MVHTCNANTYKAGGGKYSGKFEASLNYNSKFQVSRLRFSQKRKEMKKKRKENYALKNASVLVRVPIAVTKHYGQKGG